jgi:hypothetical protein
MKKTLTILGMALLSLSAWSQEYNVTFNVDMNQQSGFTTPEVNGSFNNWCGSCAPMSDPEGDGIWTLTIPLAAGTYEYKFSADNWGTQETLLAGSPCTVTNFGFTNRTLVVSADANLPVVCWGACSDCGSAPNIVDITFQLDMNGQTGFTTPEVNGTFNGWCGSCNPMTDADGDNVWTTTITLPAGDYQYKFSYDNWTGQETLVAGSSCTFTDGAFTNRIISANTDVTIDTVCWSSCDACGQSSGPYNVTFNLDMSQVGFSFVAPEINGGFNNWCGNCAALSDPDGDNIWSITIPLASGSHQYKFSYDNWSGQEEFTPDAACTFTENGFTNRLIDVTDNIVLNAVCWGSCEGCGNSVNEMENNDVRLMPNPTEDFTVINWKGSNQSIRVFNAQGQLILSEQLAQGQQQFTLNAEALSTGMYTVVLVGNETSTHVQWMVKK